MIATRAATFPRPALLTAGLGSAVLLRVIVAGDDGEGSLVAGVVFAGALLLLAAADGWRPGRLSWRSALAGLIGGAVLVAPPLWLHLTRPLPTIVFPADAFVYWAPVAMLIALGEEVLLRGVLFSALQSGRGTVTAVALTSIAFALIHVPFYGWGAVPLDLAVGLWLGSVRVVTGGVTAPAIAHAVADLGFWWLW